MSTGVYMMTALHNNKFYIGSSTSSLDKRWKNHLMEMKHKKHGNQKLQRAYDKYGKDNFSFKVLSYELPEDCLKVEQKYIDELKPFYNICRVAGNRYGAILSDKTKEKIS